MKLPKIGPAFLVTAAFIGPGTVITASMAGANYGLSLVWALLFAMFATLILQEMAARLGIVSQQGLGENIRQAFTQPFVKSVVVFLVVSAIVSWKWSLSKWQYFGSKFRFSGRYRATRLAG